MIRIIRDRRPVYDMFTLMDTRTIREGKPKKIKLVPIHMKYLLDLERQEAVCHAFLTEKYGHMPGPRMTQLHMAGMIEFAGKAPWPHKKNDQEFWRLTHYGRRQLQHLKDTFDLAAWDAEQRRKAAE